MICFLKKGKIKYTGKKCSRNDPRRSIKCQPTGRPLTSVQVYILESRRDSTGKKSSHFSKNFGASKYFLGGLVLGLVHRLSPIRFASFSLSLQGPSETSCRQQHRSTAAMRIAWRTRNQTRCPPSSTRINLSNGSTRLFAIPRNLG